MLTVLTEAPHIHRANPRSNKLPASLVRGTKERVRRGGSLNAQRFPPWVLLLVQPRGPRSWPRWVRGVSWTGGRGLRARPGTGLQPTKVLPPGPGRTRRGVGLRRWRRSFGSRPQHPQPRCLQRYPAGATQKNRSRHGALTLAHLFALDNFFKLALDPLHRDVGHGSAAACEEDPGPLRAPRVETPFASEAARRVHSVNEPSTCAQMAVSVRHLLQLFPNYRKEKSLDSPPTHTHISLGRIYSGVKVMQTKYTLGDKTADCRRQSWQKKVLINRLISSWCVRCLLPEAGMWDAGYCNAGKCLYPKTVLHLMRSMLRCHQVVQNSWSLCPHGISDKNNVCQTYTV